MLVFTKQFGAKRREKDGKKKNTPHLAMHLVLVIVWDAQLKTVKLWEYCPKFPHCARLCREKLSRCQYYSGEMA